MLAEINRIGNPDKNNILIKGDNVSVIDEISNEYAGTVQCIYIDPPYKNGEKYRHYNDCQSHEDWIKSMEVILPRLFNMLADSGVLWISIDDGEVHYLKVLCDQLFGRKRFISTIIWEHRTTRENRKTFSNNHEYLLVYAKNPKAFRKKRNLLPRDDEGEIPSCYSNPDNDPRGPWQSISLSVQNGHAVDSQYYELVSPNGKRHNPPKGRCWAYNQERMNKEIAEGNIWFGKSGNNVPRRKMFLKDAKLGLVPHTLWTATEVGTTDESKKHLLSILPDDEAFDTPKPESLLKRIIELSTDPGELVLDAFLGSGTTATTCMKLDRTFIGIDNSADSIDYAVRRIQKVVDGEQGGISAEVLWNGGSGCVVLEQMGDSVTPSNKDTQ